MMTSQTPPKSGDLFFEPIIEDYLSNRRFVRRDWLSEEIMARMTDPACPFILLTAEPGFGKSACMAQLAGEHPDWPRYFIRRDQREPLSDVDARSFLLRIGYQLAANYPDLFSKEAIRLSVVQRVGSVQDSGTVVGAKIDRILASPFHTKIVHIVQEIQKVGGHAIGLHIKELVIEPRLLDVADLQSMALFDPARAMQVRYPGQQIVILVDALDEIQYHQSAENVLTWLANCPELPPNVRFVLTSRPPAGDVRLFAEKQQRRLCRIDLTSEGDEPSARLHSQIDKDIINYVDALADEVPVKACIESRSGGSTGFIQQLIAKAEGNIGYLDLLARSIDQALHLGDDRTLSALLTTDALPVGLQGLYAFFLHQVRQSTSRQRLELDDPHTGEKYDKPVWPAIHSKILGVLAVAQEPVTLEQIRYLGWITAGWADINAAVDSLQPFLDLVGGRYRLYHATLLEFLTDARTKSDVDTQDLYIDAAECHKRIADRYRGEASSWEMVKWDRVDDYGLMYLSDHLFALRKDPAFGSAIGDLICKPFMHAKLARSSQRASLAHDLDLAAQAASAAPVSWRHLSRVCLVDATLRSWATDLPPELLGVLVELGEERQALAYANLMQSDSTRADALRTIGLFLMDSHEVVAGEKTLRDALELAESASQSGLKARCLCAAVRALTDVEPSTRASWAKEALQAAQTIEDVTKRIATLIGVANELTRAGMSEQTRSAVRCAVSDVIDGKTRLEQMLVPEIIMDLGAEGAETAQQIRDWFGWNTPSGVVIAPRMMRWVLASAYGDWVASFYGDRNNVFKMLATTEDADSVLEVVSEIGDPGLRCDSLISLAASLIGVNRPKIAARAARNALSTSK